MRSLSRRHLWSGSFVLLAAACSSSPSPTQSSEASPTHEAVKKDLEVLHALREHPVACADDAVCPSGSHCDARSGTCGWACFASSDCGPQAKCTGDGRCAPLASGEIRSTPSVTSLGREPVATHALSATSAAVGAQCIYSSDCESGTHCEASHLCVTDCDASHPCATGTTCRAGACTAPAIEQPAFYASPATVQIAPGDVSSPKLDTEHERRVVVALTSFDASLAGTTKSSPVRLDAPAGVEIACSSATTPPTSGYGATCTLDAWVFAATTLGARAEQAIWVRVPQTPSAPLGEITIHATDVTLGVGSIAVQLSDTFAHRNDTPEGEYVGDVILDGTDLYEGTHKLLDEERIRVRATRTAAGILLVDETKQLSPSGTLFYSLQANPAYNEAWIQPPHSNAFLADPVADTGGIGSLVAPFPATALTFEAGRMTGAIRYGYQRKARFELQRTGDITEPTCGATAACAQGTTCDDRVHLCEPVYNQWTRPPSPIGNDLAQERFKGWTLAAKTALASAGLADPSTGGIPVAERVACFTGFLPVSMSSLLGNDVLAYSGELTCVGMQAPPLAVPLFTYQDVNPQGTLQNQDMYAACLTELASNPPAAATPSAVFAAGGKCINLGRFAGTLVASKKNDPKLYIDLLRQWIALHSFLGKEGLIEWQQQATIDANGAAGAPRRLFEALEQQERGWDLLLSYEVTSTLLGFTRDVHADPDYRKTHSPASTAISPAHEQGVGLPVAMMDGLNVYLSVLEEAIDRTGMDAYAWCAGASSDVAREVLQERIGTTLRYAMAVEDQALLYQKAAALASPAPAWTAKWTQSRAGYLAARQRISNKAKELFQCGNPLGLSDATLPLFRPSDRGPSPSPFAASTYLVQTAQQHVAKATGFLADARQAWLSAREGTFRDEQNTLVAEQRLDDLMTQMAAPIQAACGVDAATAKAQLDPANPLTLDVEHCHLTAPSCSGSEAAGCYRGAIGEAVLGVISANTDVAIAQQSLEDQVTGYKSQTDYCTDLDVDLKSDHAFQAAHDHTMTELRDKKAGADEAALDVSHLESCVGGAVASFGLSCVESGLDLSGVISGLFGGPSVNPQQQSLEYAQQMEETEQAHQLEMEARKDHEQVKACFHEADLRMIGYTTAYMQIGRRSLDAASSYLRVRNMQTSVRQQLTEGRATVARERGRRMPSVAFHFWFGEKAAEFQNELAIGRKLTYLALQAAEYEHQTSFDDRPTIVGARHPDALNGVLNKLSFLTGTIGGQEVSPSHVVVSLRDEVLGLASDDLQNMRLQQRLLDPASRMYANGQYLGQAIEFSLNAPDPRVHILGPAVPADWNFPGAGSTCGERLLSVQAVITGSGLGTATTTSLRLMKSTTFHSQWCDGAAHADASSMPYQVGKFQPSGFLFGLDGAPSLELQRPYEDALLLARVGRPERVVLDDEASPSTLHFEERGVFGDYVLLFPAELLASPSFNVANVEDVLLRFDYVAAPKQL